MSKIAQILLPKEIDLEIDINKSIIYLNHTKLCDYSGECCYTPFNLSIADLYNHEIAYGDCSDITKAIYRLQSNSCQITSKYVDPSGSAFEM